MLLLKDGGLHAPGTDQRVRAAHTERKSCCHHPQKNTVAEGKQRQVTGIQTNTNSTLAVWSHQAASDCLVWFSFHLSTKEEMQKLRRNLQHTGLGNSFPAVISRCTTTETFQYHHCGSPDPSGPSAFPVQKLCLSMASSTPQPIGQAAEACPSLLAHLESPQHIPHPENP